MSFPKSFWEDLENNWSYESLSVYHDLLLEMGEERIAKALLYCRNKKRKPALWEMGIREWTWMAHIKDNRHWYEEEGYWGSLLNWDLIEEMQEERYSEKKTGFAARYRALLPLYRTLYEAIEGLVHALERRRAKNDWRRAYNSEKLETSSISS